MLVSPSLRAVRLRGCSEVCACCMRRLTAAWVLLPAQRASSKRAHCAPGCDRRPHAQQAQHAERAHLPQQAAVGGQQQLLHADLHVSSQQLTPSLVCKTGPRGGQQPSACAYVSQKLS